MAAEKIRLLLVDDDEGAFQMTRAMISQIDAQEIDLEWAATFEAGLEALEAGAHDLYLIDYFLEERTGMELLREARERGIRAPLVMLTGRGNRRVDVEAMKAGAQDYLVKDKIDPELLERSIRFALERHRAEEALRASEARHRAMFDHLPIGLYRTSPEGRFIDANPALVRILGHPDRDALSRKYARHFYVSPEDRDRFWRRLEREGVVLGFQSRVERGDGEAVLVRNTARLHRDPDGGLAYVEGAVEDVTTRETPGPDAPADPFFRTLFEEAGIGIVLVDRDGLIEETNPAFRRIFGASGEELAERSFVDLAAEHDLPRVLDRFEAIRRGQAERAEGEWRWRASDGTLLWARSTLVGVGGASSGPPQHLLALVEDVSEAG